MNHSTLNDAMCLYQALVGMAIVLSGFALLVFGIDGESKRTVRWGVIGLVCWGAWLGLIPVTGKGHDSLPAMAMASLVAYVLIRHGLHVNEILSGAKWWPPNVKRTNHTQQEVHP